MKIRRVCHEISEIIIIAVCHEISKIMVFAEFHSFNYKNLIVIEIRIIFRDLLMKAILNLQIIVNEKYFSTILRVKIRKELNNRRRLSHQPPSK